MAALLLCLYFVFTSCFLLWSEMVVPKKTWHINSFGPKTWRSATTASLTPAHRLDMWNVPRCGGRAQLMAPASIGQLHSQWKKNGGLAVCWKQVCKPMRRGSFLHVKKPIVFFLVFPMCGACRLFFWFWVLIGYFLWNLGTVFRRKQQWFRKHFLLVIFLIWKAFCTNLISGELQQCHQCLRSKGSCKQSCSLTAELREREFSPLADGFWIVESLRWNEGDSIQNCIFSGHRWIVKEFPETPFSAAQEMWLEKMLAAGVKTDAFSYNSVINVRWAQEIPKSSIRFVCAEMCHYFRILKQWCRWEFIGIPETQEMWQTWGLCTTKRYWACRNMVGVIPR